MSLIKIDELKSLEKNILEAISDDESLLHQYYVICLDTFFREPEIESFIITDKNLHIIREGIIEKLPYESFDLEYTGTKPRFSILEDLFDATISLSDTEKLKSFHDKNSLGTITITREGSIPNDYILVKGNSAGKVNQSWALFKIVDLIKNNSYTQTDADILTEFIFGNFSLINKSFFKKIIIAFIIYFFLRLVITLITDILLVLTIFDIIGYLGLGYVLYWMLRTQYYNNKRFESYYIRSIKK